MRRNRPQQHRQRKLKVLIALLAAAVGSLLLWRAAGVSSALWGGAAGAQQPAAAAAGAGTSPLQLGFDYPQLRRARQLVRGLCCSSEQRPAWREAAAAYAAALARLGGDAAAWQALPASPLKALLDEAAGLLQQAPLLACHADATLAAAWRQQQHVPPAAAGAAAGGATAAAAAGAAAPAPGAPRLLLAANLHNSGGVLPALVQQTLRLALALPPGSLGVSLYESGSSDTSRLWLTLLHQLLLPLGVPHTITTAGRLAPRLRLPRITLLAGLRNAALAPWFPSSSGGGGPAAAAAAAAAAAGDAGAGAAGSAELVWGSPAAFGPSQVAFVNDVFFCAEDVLRLALHRADVACGLDFYSSPWQAAAAAGGGGSSNGSSSGNAAAGSQGADDDDDDDVALPRQQPQLHGQNSNSTTDSGDGSGSVVAGTSSPGALRFYDKWVARDAAGRKLRNRPPFISHAPSAAALAAGQPVAMTACWNGLALLAAAPLRVGLAFRAAAPHECAASEASLLAHDLAAAGRRHVVMDPGVRLAYEYDQLDALGGAAATTARPGPAAAAADVSRWLGPRLTWAQVAPASQRLAAGAHVRAARCAASPGSAGCGSLLVECCDLRPGRSYVNFQTDCRMVDVLAARNASTIALHTG